MYFSAEDIQYMRRCLELAVLGKGHCAPNPMVGSVVVHNKHIIGEGYHHHYGEAHAEVNAIHTVKDKTLLSSSALYVNLEPCSHVGKTPPCADFIIQHRIPEVVIGIKDVNPQVSGRGIQKLLNAGCKVRIGCLEDECFDLNRRFITYMQQQRPYVILKWAQSLDGYIDRIRKPGDVSEPTWINDKVDLALVHKWRTEEPAIMVGTNTAINDNPQLTARLWYGTNPLRIVIDRNLRLPDTLFLFDGTAKTIVFTAKEAENKENIRYVRIDFSVNILSQILNYLYRQNIQSLIVEGGATLLQSFIDHCLWDEARIFYGDKIMGNGLKAPVLHASPYSSDRLNSSTLVVYRNS